MTGTGTGRGRPLRYEGYRSWGWLEPGRDVRAFDLASETARVPPFIVEVSGAQEARAWNLLAAHPAISLHDHLEVAPDDIRLQDEWVRDGHPATGYEGLARSGLAAVFENFGDGSATMRHFEYCVDLVGIDAVTFGPDTFFGDHAGSYGIPSGALLASGDSDYDAIVPEYVVGLENPGDYPNIVRWLVKHGYSETEISKVIGGNTLRVLEEAW